MINPELMGLLQFLLSVVVIPLGIFFYKSLKNHTDSQIDSLQKYYSDKLTNLSEALHHHIQNYEAKHEAAAESVKKDLNGVGNRVNDAHQKIHNLEIKIERDFVTKIEMKSLLEKYESIAAKFERLVEQEHNQQMNFLRDFHQCRESCFGNLQGKRESS